MSPIKFTSIKFKRLLFLHSGTCGTWDILDVCDLQNFTPFTKEGTWMSISFIQVISCDSLNVAAGCGIQCWQKEGGWTGWRESQLGTDASKSALSWE